MFGFIYRHKKIAFSLAEMLLVLFILTLMMLALPPLTKKMFATKTLDKQHGRFECYYDESGYLRQYLTYEGQAEHEAETINNPNEGCKFTPPTNVFYIMIHAVGGGGAGGSVPTNLLSTDEYLPKTVHSVSYLGISSVGLWPDWFRYLIQHNPKDSNDCGINVETCNSDAYETKKSFTIQYMPYGLAGDAGERISMFFPKLSSSTEITMKPGLGGHGAGTNGSDSVVYFKYDSTASGNGEEVIRAAGGVGGGSNCYKYSSAINGGKATDFGVGNFQAVKMKSSTFETVLENTDDRFTKSNINIQNSNNCNTSGGNDCRMPAGWGGNGSYFYIFGDRLKGSNVYQVNNYKLDASSYAQTDKWQIVTKHIPLSFYKRDGSDGNCEEKNNKVQVSGFCSRYNSAQYNCKISFNGTTYSKLVNFENGSLKDLPTDFDQPTLFENCQVVSANRITCDTKNNIEKSTHVCTKNNNSTATNFNCPIIPVIGGNVKAIQNDGYGVCQYNKGGDGAIVILW